jgi:3-methyladenine DNA glycosylase AlkD
MTMDDLIRNIRTDLRLAMNGVVSSSMRNKGVDYKMNFGVDVPRLKEIAQKYKSNAALAQELWKLDVRELKILSTMLYPVSELSEANADEWMNEIPNHEIREHLCRNLLQRLTYADELVQKWTADANESVRLTGYWLYVRLMMIQAETSKRINIQLVIEKALADVHADDTLLRTAATNVLMQVIRRRQEGADYIMEQISKFSTSANPLEKELYDNLQFEFNLKA